MTDYLTADQYAQLLKSINPVRVSKDAKGFSHVEAYEIRAHLTRIFGFARWSEDVLDQQQIFETVADKVDKNGQPVADKNGEPIPVWTVCYRSLVRLTICSPGGTVLATYTEGAVGDVSNFPSRADAHDMALKTSASQALKRCAVNLGDGYGLSLYDRGSLRPLVRGTLVAHPLEMAADADVTAHITSPLAPEGAQNGGDTQQRESSSPPASKAPATSPVPAAPSTGPAAGGGGPDPMPAPAVEVEPAALNGQGEVEAGPTAGAAATPSPAVSEAPASGPEPEEPAAEADPTPPAAADAAESSPPSGQTAPAATSGTAPEPASSEPSGIEDPIDAWEAIIGGLAVIRMSSPVDGLALLNEWMETASRFNLSNRRYPDSDKTLGAVLIEHMRDARAAIARRAAASAGAS